MDTGCFHALVIAYTAAMNYQWIQIRPTYTMEYYSAIKKNEVMSYAATWIDTEIIY